jgi:divalent metal cation (Fe/Co/Zn/Cd) transporter
MEKFKKLAIFFLWITILWNTFEGVFSIMLGLQAKSLALFAYGLESSIEIFTSVVVLLEMSSTFAKGFKEKRALQLIGIAYILVSIYIAIEAVKNIMTHQTPDTSFSGILLMVATVAMMGSLGLVKRRLGKKLNSPTVLADAKFTLIDGLLSLSVLIGLTLQFVLPFWWIDHVLALFLAVIALKEGLEELRGES